MDIAVVKVLGLVFLAIVFVVTVLMMPRIFGVDTPSTTAYEPDAAPRRTTGAASRGPKPSEQS